MKNAVRAALSTAYKKRDELRRKYLNRLLTRSAAYAIAEQEAICMTLYAVLHDELGQGGGRFVSQSNEFSRMTHFGLGYNPNPGIASSDTKPLLPLNCSVCGRPALESGSLMFRCRIGTCGRRQENGH